MKESLGFSYGQIVSNPVPSLETVNGGNIIEGKVGTRRDYTGRPSFFMSLNMVKMATGNPAFYTQPEISMEDDIPKIRIRFILVYANAFYAASFHVLLFCNSENSCTKEQNPSIVAGTINGYLGGAIVSRQLVNLRTNTISAALDKFMSSPPLYVAIGFTRLYFRGGFSAKVVEVTNKVITINLQVEGTNQFIWHAYTRYLVSNWRM